MSNTYNDNSIKALKGADRVRLRPGVMLGSDDVRGAMHTVYEIVGNSADEAREGFGEQIIVKYHEDGSVSVQDFGRGVPMGWNEKEQRYNWDLIFNELYAGGKYTELQDEMNLEEVDPFNMKLYRIGLNGLGSAATQYSSEWTKVVSRRPEGVFTKHFAKGVPTDEELLVEPNETGETGTFVHWLPDTEVFSSIDFTTQMFKLYLETQSHLNELKIVLIDERHSNGEVTEYRGEGIESYLREKIGDSNVVEILSKQEGTKGYENGKPYVAMVDILLAITKELPNSVYMHHHNTGVMKIGVHHQAFDDAVGRFFKNIGTANGVKITPYDYNGYLSILSSSYSTVTSFANQTKDGVSNMFIYNMVYNTVLDMLDEAVAMQKESITTLVDNVVTAALARKKAKEIEAQERLVSKVTSARRPKAEKFTDCREKDPKKRELFIVEGDSAKGACKNARDAKFQALLPIKGKIVNGLKASLEDLLGGGKDKDGKPKKGNKEVLEIISTLGTGVDINGSSELFDIEKLQFDKIIITTDADVDGYQIRVLLYTIFYRLMPQLLEAGKVYVAETPLFELEMSNGESWFAYTLDEKAELEEKARQSRLSIKKINRSKGLGENNPDMLWLTTMNPETRRLVKLDIDIKDQVVRDISNMLFGNDPTNERKGFVFSLLEEKLGEDVLLNDLIETVESLEGEREELVEEEAI